MSYVPPAGRWPHQLKCFSDVTSAILSGCKTMCVTSPTGGGKSVMMTDLILWANEMACRTSLYTNRCMLTEQTHNVLDQCGISHGVRAAGWSGDVNEPVQICSIQTEHARVKRGVWAPPKADLVLIDEAHVNKSGMAESIIKHHVANGAAVIGFTATPVDIPIYERLIVAGTNTELRQCGALLKCHTYAPEEPDLKNIRRQASGEYSENEVRRVMRVHTIIGRVLEWYKKLNPDQLPSILFAPGVQESIWFTDQFVNNGISAAHIDGDDCYLGEKDSAGNPIMHKSDTAMRQRIADGSKSGEIKVVCNRFVMREGINWPWLYHCILATAMGGITSYLQSVGRLLRSYPGLGHVVLQDHGANYHRHGSPNEDREWCLTDTNYSIATAREERIREKKEEEPILCPKCRAMRLSGPLCPCGFTWPHHGRYVAQLDGKLKYQQGQLYPPRKVIQKPENQKRWERAYYRAKSAGMTFRQAEALFVREHHYYPPRDLPLMPKSDCKTAWQDKVKDVPRKDLN